MSEENKIEENTKKLPVKKRYIFTSLAIIGALAAGYFIYDALGYQSTDDAYVETTTVSVSPKVSGQIVKVLVKDNQPVKAGQVVAVIDKIDYQVKLDQATAAYEKALLNQQNAHANLNAANSEIALAQKDLDSFLLTNPFFSSVSSNLPVLALSFKISLAKSLWHNSGLLSKTSNTEYSSQVIPALNFSKTCEPKSLQYFAVNSIW